VEKTYASILPFYVVNLFAVLETLRPILHACAIVSARAVGKSVQGLIISTTRRARIASAATARTIPFRTAEPSFPKNRFVPAN
jgi:hypothetical protein